MAKITLYVTDDLRIRMNANETLNWSKIMQDEIIRLLGEKEAEQAATDGPVETKRRTVLDLLHPIDPALWDAKRRVDIAKHKFEAVRIAVQSNCNHEHVVDYPHEEQQYRERLCVQCRKWECYEFQELGDNDPNRIVVQVTRHELGMLKL